ncbi:hypothetical protein Bhyg_13158, partial [Pseudolycoriella hygida]
LLTNSVSSANADDKQSALFVPSADENRSDHVDVSLQNCSKPHSDVSDIPNVFPQSTDEVSGKVSPSIGEKIQTRMVSKRKHEEGDTGEVIIEDGTVLCKWFYEPYTNKPLPKKCPELKKFMLESKSSKKHRKKQTDKNEKPSQSFVNTQCSVINGAGPSQEDEKCKNANDPIENVQSIPTHEKQQNYLNDDDDHFFVEVEEGTIDVNAAHPLASFDTDGDDHIFLNVEL